MKAIVVPPGNGAESELALDLVAMPKVGETIHIEAGEVQERVELQRLRVKRVEWIIDEKERTDAGPGTKRPDAERASRPLKYRLVPRIYTEELAGEE